MDQIRKHIRHVHEVLDDASEIAGRQLPRRGVTEDELVVECVRRESLRDILADLHLPLGKDYNQRVSLVQRLDEQAAGLRTRLSRRRQRHNSPRAF